MTTHRLHAPSGDLAHRLRSHDRRHAPGAQPRGRGDRADRSARHRGEHTPCSAARPSPTPAASSSTAASGSRGNVDHRLPAGDRRCLRARSTRPTPPPQQAQSDLTTAYNNAAGRPVNATTAADLAQPRRCRAASTPDRATVRSSLTGPLVLDGAGNPNTVFIFQTDSSLTPRRAAR